MGNTYNRVYIWCCKYGENRYCERCANKKLCASKHTGLLNSCLGKLCLHPYLVVPLISARVTLISTRVSAHCHAILLWHSKMCRFMNENFKYISYLHICGDLYLNKFSAIWNRGRWRICELKIWLNPLWPKGAIWRHYSGSNLAYVMAYCLMTPSLLTFIWEWFLKK